jgi:hypothetical protein
MSHKEKYLKYKAKYLNLQDQYTDAYMYNQYGGKINNDSLKVGLLDLRNYYESWKTEPENNLKVTKSNFEQMKNPGFEKALEDPKQDDIRALIQLLNFNSSYIDIDLEIVLSYIYSVFMQMIPFIHIEHNKDLAKPSEKDIKASFKSKIKGFFHMSDKEKEEAAAPVPTPTPEPSTGIDGNLAKFKEKEIIEKKNEEEFEKKMMAQTKDMFNLKTDNIEAEIVKNIDSNDILDKFNQIKPDDKVFKSMESLDNNDFRSNIVPEEVVKLDYHNSSSDANKKILYCRCKILKDVVYFILAAHLINAAAFNNDTKDAALADLKAKKKSTKLSLSNLLGSLNAAKTNFFANMRGTFVDDLFSEPGKPGKPGKLGMASDSKSPPKYSLANDFDCMLNVLMTVINVSMAINEYSDAYLYETGVKDEKGNEIKLLDVNIVAKIIQILKSSVQTFTTTICQKESKIQKLFNIKSTIAKSLEGNKMNGIIWKIYNRVKRNRDKFISKDEKGNEEMKKLKEFKKATSIFFSEINLIVFTLTTKDFKGGLEKLTESFSGGIKLLFEIIKRSNSLPLLENKAIVDEDYNKKGGAAVGIFSEEAMKHQRDGYLLLIKSILIGVAITLIIKGTIKLIRSGGANIADMIIGSLKIFIGGLIFARLMISLKSVKGYNLSFSSAAAALTDVIV